MIWSFAFISQTNESSFLWMRGWKCSWYLWLIEVWRWITKSGWKWLLHNCAVLFCYLMSSFFFAEFCGPKCWLEMNTWNKFHVCNQMLSNALCKKPETPKNPQGELFQCSFSLMLILGNTFRYSKYKRFRQNYNFSDTPFEMLSCFVDHFNHYLNHWR